MREPLKYTPEDYLKAKHIFNGHIGHSWFYFKEWNLSIMAPPKCGSTAIKQFIWMNEFDGRVTPMRHYQATGNIFVVTREPVSRFLSLWRSKCRDKANLKDTRVHGMSLDELMTHIESGAKDVHWTPQSSMIANLEVELIPLDQFNSWWKYRGYGNLEKFNSTAGETKIDETLKNRVLTFYAEDAILHARSEKEFKLNIQ